MPTGHTVRTVSVFLYWCANNVTVPKINATNFNLA